MLRHSRAGGNPVFHFWLASAAADLSAGTSKDDEQ